jgi:hypothetical protein
VTAVHEPAAPDAEPAPESRGSNDPPPVVAIDQVDAPFADVILTEGELDQSVSALADLAG